jgi:tetratricopeptide (TPR) repeat protein
LLVIGLATAYPAVSSLVLGAALLAGCSRDADPTRVANKADLLAPAAPTPAADRESPFKNPSTDPPPPRSEPQVDDATLARLLTEADQHLAAGNTMKAATVLQDCANKVPPSVRCEAKLAIALTGKKAYKAHARYYLREASMVDDPTIDADLYRELADAALAAAQFEAAEDALNIVVSRPNPTAQDYAELSRALQADANNTAAALDALELAYRLDPSQPKWLRDMATLSSQLGDMDRARELIRRYAETIGDPRSKAEAEAWLAQLDASASSKHSGPPDPRQSKPRAPRANQRPRATAAETQ